MKCPWSSAGCSGRRYATRSRPAGSPSARPGDSGSGRARDRSARSRRSRAASRCGTPGGRSPGEALARPWLGNLARSAKSIAERSSLVDEADGLLEAAAHAVERLAELRHLVAALVRKLRRVELALRDV